MKFLLSVAVYLVFAAMFSWGIYGMMEGKFAVLIVTFLVYFAIAAKKGCLDTH